MSDVIRTVDLTKRFIGNCSSGQLESRRSRRQRLRAGRSERRGQDHHHQNFMNLHKPDRGQAEVFGVDSRRIFRTTSRKIGYVSENQEMPEWMTVGSFWHI